jgi:hypothetical protein
MEVIKLDFKKTLDLKTDLKNKGNLENLYKYVFPIIERNEGWGTGSLTVEEFEKDPGKFQDDIDATVWDNVHILLEKDEPIALLEFEETEISDTSKSYHKILIDLLENPADTRWRILRERGWLIPDKTDLSLIKSYLISKSIYLSIGIVIKPELQGKKTGISESLYKIISDGINFGWTSNPIIVRQRRKLFKNTLYFPLFNENPKTLEELAIRVYVYAYILSHKEEEYKGLELGALYSDYFVAQRGDEYIQIAREMAIRDKILPEDLHRIEYILNRRKCAGAIVSWN